MKRSDAIKLLLETHGACDSWLKQCEYMLEQLEAAKMKPPWNDAEYQRQCREYCEPEGYAWEPE